MTAPPTRVLVLGTGSSGERHLRTLGAVPGVRPVAVPVRTERAAELRVRGYDALGLADALALEPHGAVIATDTGRHAADAQALLDCCDVLVEKPLAADAEAAHHLADRARARGRALHVACCLRFDAGLVWVRERLEALGPVRLADVECLSWLPDWRPGRDHLKSYAARPGEGGVLLDLVHEIDYCTWLLGPARRVTARLENRGAVGLPTGIEETATLLLEHATGVTTNLRLSYAARPPSRHLRVWGEHGRLSWDGLGRRALLEDVSGAEIEQTTWPGPDTMYRAQAEAWVAALRGDPSPRLVSGVEGARAVAVCDAARRSARGHTWEELG